MKTRLLNPSSIYPVLAAVLFPTIAVAAPDHGGVWFDMHLITATLTSAVFVIALLIAVILAVQTRHLHNTLDLLSQSDAHWVSRLPPILTMERLLVQVLVLAFVLLTLLMATGMFFGETVWGEPLKFNHKILFTVLSWLTIAVLLLGRHWRGWRGMVLVRSTIIGFILLFLAYVGTHFVMDVLLHRS